MVGVNTDIEDRKRAEAELRALKDQLYKENLVLRDEVDRTSMFEEIVGTSAALQPVLARVAKVAPTESTVLITGETGTGKELVARAIHRRSPRAVAGLRQRQLRGRPRDLIASELFGHEKGAFTGATQRRLGRFELAHGGTHLPRRSRRAAAGDPGHAAPRPAGARVRARRRERHRFASTCASSPRQTATCKRRSRRARSAATSYTG